MLTNLANDKLLSNYKPIPVVYQLRYAILRRIKAGKEILPEIQGRAETKNDVIRALLSGAHPYLVSEEGTGKTRLARSIANLLPPLLKIKGCPYNDDPKWPRELLCPRCRQSKDPGKEFGIEVVLGEKRFSRIQGNEYTNEAKLLGLKDIQAIAQGKSPSDPTVFTGTGVFRANRGILFVDELPAIRTNVQVLLHPILEEKKVILEEYNWQHPLDLILIATGNPKGFSHVYEVPRPLLDRLELIYMELPEEDEEREIMLRERFGVKGESPESEDTGKVIIPDAELAEAMTRSVVLPWWIVDIANKAVRYSRICTKLERRASIRASNRTIDHTYANLELENRKVAHLRDAYSGLSLALRGRIELNSEYLDIENPKVSFRRTDRLVEDLMWNAIEDFDSGIFDGYERERLAEELRLFLSSEGDHFTERLPQFPKLNEIVTRLKKMAKEKVIEGLLNEVEKKLIYQPEKVAQEIIAEYNYSAIETVVNLAIHRRLVSESLVGRFFFPQKLSELKPW